MYSIVTPSSSERFPALLLLAMHVRASRQHPHAPARARLRLRQCRRVSDTYIAVVQSVGSQHSSQGNLAFKE